MTFPAAYRGYLAWVNSAELLPVGDDLQAFLKGGNVPGACVRRAGRSGMTVTSPMCAPAGRAYWLVVDSGMAKVAIGQVGADRSGPCPVPSTARP